MTHNTPPSEPVMTVSAHDLAKLFNEGDYTERLSHGQLRKVLINENHLQAPTAIAKGMPYCTTGKIYRYVDKSDVWHAEVHQYVKPDGTLGASGKPDPKRLRKDGKIWKLLRQ